MNPRERYAAVMHYQPRDRCPIMDFGFWDETLPIWQEQGYPAGADPDLFFGMDPQWRSCGCIMGLWPPFPGMQLVDEGETEIVQQNDGVIVQRGKFLGSDPASPAPHAGGSRELERLLQAAPAPRRPAAPALWPCLGDAAC
ncbi:MAG: hypothetical protein IPM07_24190 [Anaerolineales bacterium]|nr:hypothetical protein [Anaerolineales bacterium]